MLVDQQILEMLEMLFNTSNNNVLQATIEREKTHC